MMSVSSLSAEPLQWSGGLTLAQAIQRAQTSGFDVRMAQADADAAAAREAASRANVLPQVGVSGTTSNGGITQLGMPYAQQTYILATASVPIFVPSAFNTAKAAAHSAEAAGYSTAAQRNDAMLLATRAYERALLAAAVVESRTVTVGYQQRHVDDVAVRVRTGDSARYQLFESQAALAQAQQALEDAAVEHDTSISDLEVTLDLAITPALRLSDMLTPLTLSGGVATFARRALSQRPEVLAAQTELQAAQARGAASRAQYLPAIVANAQTYNGHSNPPLGPTGYQVGITASLPVFDGGSRPAAVHEANAGVQRAQALLEQADLSAQRDVANAWREYEAAQRNLETAHVQAAAATEELRVATLRERSGKGTTLEMLSALSDDAAARENALRAVARFNDAIAAVHHAAGDASST
jgi:outer membrane protein, multidrug efflux system